MRVRPEFKKENSDNKILKGGLPANKWFDFISVDELCPESN